MGLLDHQIKFAVDHMQRDPPAVFRKIAKQKMLRQRQFDRALDQPAQLGQTDQILCKTLATVRVPPFSKPTASAASGTPPRSV